MTPRSRWRPRLDRKHGSGLPPLRFLFWQCF
jgi:hypothetical protein